MVIVGAVIITTVVATVIVTFISSFISVKSIQIALTDIILEAQIRRSLVFHNRCSYHFAAAQGVFVNRNLIVEATF